MAGKIIADTIEASGSQISLNVGNVTILTASSTGLTLIPTTNVNVNLTNSIVTLTNGSSTGPGLTFSGNTRTGLFMPAANTVAFTAANTEVMRIDSSGNVGIGTNSPSYPLDVAGAIRGNSWIGRANGSAPTADCAVYRPADSSLGFSTGSAERMRIDSSGNVGIGTNSPTQKLDVLGIGRVYSSATGTPAQFITENTGSGDVYVDLRSNSALKTRLYYDSANLLIGLTAVPAIPIVFKTSDTERMRIISSGQVGINATPASGNTFRVINIGTDNACQFGNASSGVYLPYASPTAWSSYSDSRLKDVVGNYENALEHILQLNPVKYTWKYDKNKKVNIGLLAQNVLEVVPEIVDENTLPNDEEDKTKYLSLRYTDLIPVLIGSIQELKAIVDAQAVEIAALKAK